MKTKVLRSWVILLLLAGVPTSSWAGIVELGASANFRRSTIDDNNFQESTSYTGSLSYYFWEMSALELSYTEGEAFLSVKPLDDTKIITTSTFKLIGVDLIITLGSQQSTLQPYVKIGGAHIEKKIVRQAEGLDASEIESPSGIVPSAGIGLKIALGRSFSIKIGLDAWTSPMGEKNKTLDYAGRAGISWMF